MPMPMLHFILCVRCNGVLTKVFTICESEINLFGNGYSMLVGSWSVKDNISFFSLIGFL